MPIKKCVPTTPGRRIMSFNTYEELTTDEPRKSLMHRLQKHGGRNSRGIITCRHRGGGHTRQYRSIDLKQKDNFNITGIVNSIEYDPNRSSYIMLVKYKNGDVRYLLAPHGMKVGSEVVTAPKTKIRIGNRLQLQYIPTGFEIYNLETSVGSGGQAVRSAGGCSTIIGFDGPHAQVQMPSREVRMIRKECFASVGRVSNIDHNLVVIGTAGRNRWKGKRPQVRGKVMNPNDHPHGGGEAKNQIGLKYPKTPWGAHALGVPTRHRKKATSRLIIKNRKGRILKALNS